MYKCCNCEKVFQEEETKKMCTSYESEYGVNGMFFGDNLFEKKLCPCCLSDDLEDYKGESEEEDES